MTATLAGDDRQQPLEPPLHSGTKTEDTLPPGNGMTNDSYALEPLE